MRLFTLYLGGAVLLGSLASAILAYLVLKYRARSFHDILPDAIN